MISLKKDILLTIGIPVYNGGSHIAETIESIEIPDELKGMVEIIVSDNCSTDNTREIISGYHHVHYFRNDENVRYDRNVHNLFEKANGKFVWTLAADDKIFTREAVNLVIKIITEERDLGLIHVGGGKTLNREYEKFSNELFFIASNFQSGGVSTNIINRAAWFASNPVRFFDSEWIHFGVIIELVNRYKSVVTKEALAGENPSTSQVLKTWDLNGRSLVVMLKLIKLFKNMEFLGYSKEFQKRAKYLIRDGYPKDIIKAKAKGLVVNKQLVAEFINCYKEFASFWFLDLPILLFPRFLCRLIYNQRKHIKMRNED